MSVVDLEGRLPKISIEFLKISFVVISWLCTLGKPQGGDALHALRPIHTALVEQRITTGSPIYDRTLIMQTAPLVYRHFRSQACAV